jgi:hypothetical protein
VDKKDILLVSNCIALVKIVFLLSVVHSQWYSHQYCCSFDDDGEEEHNGTLN